MTAKATALTSGPLTGDSAAGFRLLIDGVEVDAPAITTNWQQVFTVSDLAVGNHVITAEFVDTYANYHSSTSAPVAYGVLPVPRAVKAEFHSSRHGDIPAGTAVAVQAVIESCAVGGATPAGWVQFYDWNTKVGSPVKSVNGQAAYTYASLKDGKHVLQAKYIGSSVYIPAFTPARTVRLG